MLVLPVARATEPRVKYVAISSFDLTSASVTPANVMPPLTVSLICIGALEGPVDFAASRRSKTSSLKI